MTGLHCSSGRDDCEGRIHQHHDDYSKMDETRPLCAKHHREWHTVNGRAMNWASGPNIPVTVMLPREVFERLRIFAAEDERSAQKLVRLLIFLLIENPTVQDCVRARWGFPEKSEAAA